MGLKYVVEVSRETLIMSNRHVYYGKYNEGISSDAFRAKATKNSYEMVNKGCRQG